MRQKFGFALIFTTPPALPAQIGSRQRFGTAELGGCWSRGLCTGPVVLMADLTRLKYDRSRAQLDEVITLRFMSNRERGRSVQVIERAAWARREGVETVEDVEGRRTSTPAEVAFVIRAEPSLKIGDEIRDGAARSYRVTKVEHIGRQAFSRVEVIRL